jgi:hypothetical protein
LQRRAVKKIFSVMIGYFFSHRSRAEYARKYGTHIDRMGGKRTNGSNDYVGEVARNPTAVELQF